MENSTVNTKCTHWIVIQYKIKANNNYNINKAERSVRIHYSVTIGRKHGYSFRSFAVPILTIKINMHPPVAKQSEKCGRILPNNSLQVNSQKHSTNCINFISKRMSNMCSIYHVRVTPNFYTHVICCF